MAHESNEGMINRFHFDAVTPTVVAPVVTDSRPDGGDLTIGTADTFDYANADITGVGAHIFDDVFSFGKELRGDEPAAYAVTWQAPAGDSWLFILNGDSPVIQHNGVAVDFLL